MKVRTTTTSSSMMHFYYRVHSSRVISYQSANTHPSVTTLIPPEIWSVIRQASSLMADGCTNPSDNFATYAFDLLNTTNLLPADFTQVSNFLPCDYLPEIQEALGYTPAGSSSSLRRLNTATDVTFLNLVVLPQSLIDNLVQYFGADVELNGEFLLNSFGTITLRRFLSFISDFFSGAGTTARRKLERGSRESNHLERSQVVKRGSVMRAVRETMQPFVHSSRRLATSTLFELPVNDMLSLTFDYNFGDTEKIVMLGAHFDFESGDTAVNAIKGVYCA